MTDRPTSAGVDDAALRRFLRQLPRRARRNLVADATAGLGWLSIGLPWLVTIAGTVGIGWTVAGFIPSMALLWLLLAPIAGIGLGVWLMSVIEFRAVRRLIRRDCPDGRLRCCPVCSYDLRALTSPLCTECGHVVWIGG